MGLCDFKMWLGEMWYLLLWDKSVRQIHIGVEGINFSYPHITVTRPPSKYFNNPLHFCLDMGECKFNIQIFDNSSHLLLMGFENDDFNNLLIMALICPPCPYRQHVAFMLPCCGKIFWIVCFHLLKIFWYADMAYWFTITLLLMFSGK